MLDHRRVSATDFRSPRRRHLSSLILVPSFHRRSMTSCAQKIPCSGLWDMWLNGTSRHEATDDAMFTLLLKATLAETAASIVDLRTNVDGWREGPVSDVYDPSLGG